MDTVCPNAYGDLKRVLMHRPGRELDLVTERTLKEFHFARPVNRERFTAEYDTMAGLFQAHGVETLMLTDVLRDDADAVVLHRASSQHDLHPDLASVFSRGAVLMSPHLKGRWGDQLMLGRAFERLGVPVAGSHRATRISRRRRSDFHRRGHRRRVALRSGERDRHPHAAGSSCSAKTSNTFSRSHFRSVISTSTASSWRSSVKLALIYPESFRVFPCRLYEDGESDPRHIMFEEFLRERDVRTIVITAERASRRAPQRRGD